MAISLTGPEPVLEAVAEFDRLGREAFLRRYGFGKAREYFLLMNGKYYDSKAIAGVAHQYEPAVGRPLEAGEFTGGEGSVQRPLEKLGFTVIRAPGGYRPPESPLVLVENEVTLGGEYDFWADETGVRYQYPNVYRNRVRTNRPFVYYRGTRRAGGQRGSPEYFGRGVIGEIWRDPEIPEDVPKRQWRWYCAIEDYEAFDPPVPAKIDGATLEPIDTPIGWRMGVREIPWSTYKRIVELAGMGHIATIGESVVEKDALQQTDLADLVVLRSPGSGGGGGGTEGARRSAESTVIGNRAEAAVYDWLRANLSEAEAATLRWHAKAGEKPGYDLSYERQGGETVGVEVKGTTLARFASIELTANEWNSARELGDRFQIALVGGVGTGSAALAFLNDPAGMCDKGLVSAVPITWRLTLAGA